MTRENKLNICKGCAKRTINLQVGLVCSLTNEVGDFENSCPSFVDKNQEVVKPPFSFNRQRKKVMQKMSTFLF